MQIIKSKVVLLLTIFGLLYTVSVNAQVVDGSLGSYTPYSMFGLGDLATRGTAYHKGMGGIGIGIRNSKYINVLNTASITQRDTLSFMMDFGVENKNIYTADSKTTSAYNTFGMHNFAMSFPIYKKSAFIVGITPVVDVGYRFQSKETDLELINELGDVTYEKRGEGGVSKIFLGGAMVIAKYFSVGLEGSYYFGNQVRESNIMINPYLTEGKESVGYKTINTGWRNKINGFGAKASMQYSHPLAKNMHFTLGATYGFAANLNSENTRYAYAISSNIVADTVAHVVSDSKISLPMEIAAGFSLSKRDPLSKRDIWSLGFDYIRQDWSEVSFLEGTLGSDFSGDLMQSFRGGFEITPNMYDVRYYMKRVTYRVGAYHNKTYMNFGGTQINSIGVTAGMTLPVRQRSHTGISLSLDLGQRGTISNNLLRERYAIFSVNLNLHDIWFQQFRYD